MKTIPQTDAGNKGKDRVPVTVRLPKSLDRAMEIAVVHRDGFSKQQLVEDAVRAYLGNTEPAA